MPRRRAIPLARGNVTEEEAQEDQSVVNENEEMVQITLMSATADSDTNQAVGNLEDSQAPTMSTHRFQTVFNTSPPPDASPVAMETTSGPTEKRKLSLEALFQAAHSELENISKGNESSKTETVGRASTVSMALDDGRVLEGMSGKRETMTVIEVPHMESAEGTSYLINTGGSGGTLVQQLKQVVNTEDGSTLYSVSEGPSPPVLVHNTLSGFPYQIKSAGVLHQSEQAANLFRAQSLDDAALEKSKQSGSTPTVLMLTPSATVGAGGRKRKHPQKPGKHLCPYCNRGCAKPSVLKKHIRAHTGERPYPCDTCGFAFKTKSNLYKHCKSRWHQLKLGLKEGDGSAHKLLSKDFSFGGDVDDEDEDDDDGDDEDDDEDDAEDGEGKLQIDSTPSTSLSPLQSQSKTWHAKSLDFSASSETPTKKGLKRNKSEIDTRRLKKLKRQSADDSQDALKKLQTFRFQAGGTVISRPVESPEVTLAVAEKKVQEGISTLLPKPDPPPTKTVPDISAMPVSLANILNIEKTINITAPTVTAYARKPLPMVTESILMLPSTNFPPFSLPLLSATSGAITMPTVSPVSSIQLPLKVTPTVLPVRMTGAPRNLLSKSYTTGDYPVSSEITKTKAGLSFSRSASLQVGGTATELSTQKPRPERQHLSAEKVMERISNLISLNQTIISTPMAEPPRKRVMRQASVSMAQVTMPQFLGGLHSNPLTRSSSMTDRLVQIAPMPVVSESTTGVVLSRSLSMQAMPTLLPSQPLALTSMAPTPQPDTPVSHEQPVVNPMIQLPPNFLNPAQAVPRQIKIQFKVPKESSASPTKGLPIQTRSLDETSLDILSHKTTLQPVQPVEVQAHTAPVIETQPMQKDVNPFLENRPRLGALQQSGSIQSVQSEQSTQQVVPTKVPDTPKYVCGACWQVHHSIESLQEHICQPTPDSKGRGTEFIEVPTVVSSLDSTSPPDKPPDVIVTPAVATETIETTVAAAAVPRAKRILQRQKNVVVEMVDPRVAPKRGRPKGAKSVKNLRIDSPSKRPPLVRSQSTIEPSNRGDNTLGENPTALWKLKLKGHLLMKRSMSVERMLSQEKEQLGGGQVASNAESKSTLTAKSRQALLLRSKSYDEAAMASPQTVQESRVRERLLSKLSRSCVNLTRSQSIDVEDEPMGEEDKPSDATTEVEEAVQRIMTPVSKQELNVQPAIIHCPPSPQSMNEVETVIVPTNEAMEIQLNGGPVFTPKLLIQKLGMPLKFPTPVTLSIPVNIAHKVPGLLHEAKLSFPESEEKSEDVIDVDKDTTDVDIISSTATSTDESSTRDQQEVNNTGSPQSNSESMDTDQTVASGAEPSSQLEQPPPKKKNVCTLHTIQMAGASKQVRNKISATLNLLGHTYPSMKTNTMATFCCIHKTQPMYVEKRANQNVSMYSNWRAAPYNPNPKGLDSKMLLDLYQTQRHDCEPRFIISGAKTSTEITHSNYWVTREEEFLYEESEAENHFVTAELDERRGAREARKAAKREIYPDVIIQSENLRPTTPVEVSVTIPAPIEVPAASTTRDRLKEALTVDKPKRIQIFDGGYKSLEDYTYIRGRGRGRYVCEKCGIRCKKPSMLKKHIRTHTDLRPYHCRYCNFAFKTKGNLTKHMKSKSHHKLCFDMGIIPVPTHVDDNCIVSDFSGSTYSLDDSQSVEIAEEIVEDDEDEDDDDDDDDDDGEDEDLEDLEDNEDEEDDSQIDGTSVEVNPEMLEVEIVSHPTKDISELDDEEGSAESTPEKSSNDKEETDSESPGHPSASLDKEIAAASLLDLSKVTGSKITESGSEDDDSQVTDTTDAEEKREDEKVDADDLQAKSGAQSEEMAMSMAVDGPVKTRDIVLQTFKYLRSNSNYAKKIAMLQAANSTNSGETPVVSFSGFSPPFVMFPSGEIQMAPVQSQEATKSGIEDSSKSENLGPIVGQFILPDFKTEGAQNKEKDKGSSSSTSKTQETKSVIIRFDSIPTSSTDQLRRQMAALRHEPAVKSRMIQDLKVHYVDTDDHAPCEILPIPVGSIDTSQDEELDGKYSCFICRKTFHKAHQLKLHKNIHMVEKPYRCTDCSIAFQSRMLLDKHHTSDRHHQQVAALKRMGAPTAEDPRPFKCEECNIAFRILGHLARHLRSKMHISKLEALGKVPVGTYDQVEYGPTHTASTGTNATKVESAKPQQIVKANTVQNIVVSALKMQSKKPAEQSSEIPTDADKIIAESASVEQERVSVSPMATVLSASPKVVIHPTSSEQDAGFQYQSTDEYEKVDLASNERVTVEIKSEPIEFGEIVPKVSQKRDETEMEVDKDAEGGSTDGPHKCGICCKRFKDMEFLKRHLVSHAELRPYVCEYCDAGFTTSQSLKFHLQTHTQECPYICGHCGATFGRSDNLQTHCNEVHCGGMMEFHKGIPSEKPQGPMVMTTSLNTLGNNIGSVPNMIVHAKAQPSPMLNVGAANPLILQKLTSGKQILRAIPSTHFSATFVNPRMVQENSQESHSQQSEAQVFYVPSSAPQKPQSPTAEHVVLSQEFTEKHDFEREHVTEIEIVDKDVEERQPEDELCVVTDEIPCQELDDQVQNQEIITEDLGNTTTEGDVIELDLNHYDVQECIEEGPDGEQRIIYMLMGPNQSKVISVTGDDQDENLGTLEADSSSQDDSMSHVTVADGGSRINPVLESHSYVARLEDKIDGVSYADNSTSDPNTSTYDQDTNSRGIKVIYPTNEEPSQNIEAVQLANPLSGSMGDKFDLPRIDTASVVNSSTDEPPQKWRVIETEGSMSLSPIFESEDPGEGQGRDDPKTN